MKTKIQSLRRAVYFVLPLALGFSTLSVLVPQIAQEASAAQVTSRSIQLSDAGASDTSVKYNVSFKAATTGSNNVQAIIVDFCDNDPLVLDTTCSTPGGFTLTGAPTVSNQDSTAGCNLSTFTTVATQNSNRTFELSAASAISTTSGTVCTFTINGVTNPNTANHSFYARIYTYDTTAHANSYAAGGTAGVVDSGGVALSTSSTISLQANVEEELTFCVSGDAIDDSSGACTTTGGLTTPSLQLGHTVGSTKVLDSTAVDTANAYTELSTNALSGVVVDMKELANTCTGLSRDSGATCPIEGVANGTISAGENNSNPGGAFAMCVNKGANTTVVATYKDTTNNCPTGGFNATSEYGMGTTTSTYGDQILSTASAVKEEQNTCVFAATAAPVTPAGTYSGSESLIATGTF